jgi:FlaA1/EpsC-like NDP-sugar epimerase
MVTPPITRREFIGATAAAGAGLLLTSCSPDSNSKNAANKASALNKINIALIGCGAQGQVLLDSLRVIEGIRLVAVVDIWDYNRNSNVRRLKDNGFEVKGYHDYEELLANEKDLQAVIVAMPDFWHAPVTNACLKAGLLALLIRLPQLGVRPTPAPNQTRFRRRAWC